MSSAVISDCQLYRYRLEREVCAEGKVFAYFGINPSTADAALDDPTVRKWRGFTLRNGGRRFIVGNIFALRATDVREVSFPNNLQALDAQGRAVPYRHAENSQHIRQIIAEADVLVPCWGSTAKITPRLRYCIGELLEVLLASGKPVMHLGLTKGGDPRHPLMLGYDTPLTLWGDPAERELRVHLVDLMMPPPLIQLAVQFHAELAKVREYAAIKALLQRAKGEVLRLVGVYELDPRDGELLTEILVRKADHRHGEVWPQ
ncbi:TPA: DUF1643 domain-containing protein [Pseudomonas putida]